VLFFQILKKLKGRCGKDEPGGKDREEEVKRKKTNFKESFSFHLSLRGILSKDKGKRIIFRHFLPKRHKKEGKEKSTQKKKDK